MRVFFDTTYRREAENDKNYKIIYKTIKDLDHIHIFHDIIKRTPLETPLKKKEDLKKTHFNLYKSRMGLLQEADVNVFEASIPSLSTGFLIEKSLDINKPTIVLYSEKQTPILIAGIENEKLIVRSYNDNNIRKVIIDAFRDVQYIRDKRFNFFISPSLLRYLDTASKRLGVTKSTFIRNLILEHKSRNNE